MIIDAIIFSNEIDILDVRLHELDPVVDKFVIVESREMHGSDRSKAANLQGNWDVIRPFVHKVEYVVLEHLEPPHRGPGDSWPRENFHRNAIMPAVQRIMRSGRDLLMISDCDEIPRAETIRHNVGRLMDGVHALTQDFFYYDVNNYVGTWHGTCVGTIDAILSADGPQAVRNRRDSWPALADGGWHFSYFGGYEQIMSKLQNFAHACEDSSKLVCCRSRADIINDILTGADIYQRPGEGRKERRSHDDPRLPVYLRENIGRFRLATEDGLREVFE